MPQASTALEQLKKYLGFYSSSPDRLDAAALKKDHEEADGIQELKQILSKLSLVDLNYVLYRCEHEEENPQGAVSSCCHACGLTVIRQTPLMMSLVTAAFCIVDSKVLCPSMRRSEPITISVTPSVTTFGPETGCPAIALTVWWQTQQQRNLVC